MSEMTPASLEAVPCPVCTRREHRPFCALEDRWCNPPHLTWTIVECRQCHLLLVSPRPTVRDLDLFYPSTYYDPPTPPDDWWVRQLACDRVALVQRWHPTPGRLLEVGFGAGDLLVGLHQRGWEVWGVDPSVEAVRQTGAKLASVDHLKRADLLAAGLPANYFDVVVLWHSIEHLPDPRAVLQETARCLCSGGRVVIATPNGQTVQRRVFGRAWSAWRGIGAPPRHLFFFSPRTLSRLAQSVGLSVLEVNQRVDTLANFIAFKGSLLAWLGQFDYDTPQQPLPPSSPTSPRWQTSSRQFVQTVFRSGCWMTSTILAWCGSGDTMVLVARKP